MKKILTYTTKDKLIMAAALLAATIVIGILALGCQMSIGQSYHILMINGVEAGAVRKHTDVEQVMKQSRRIASADQEGILYADVSYELKTSRKLRTHFMDQEQLQQAFVDAFASAADGNTVQAYALRMGENTILLQNEQAVTEVLEQVLAQYDQEEQYEVAFQKNENTDAATYTAAVVSSADISDHSKDVPVVACTAGAQTQLAETIEHMDEDTSNEEYTTGVVDMEFMQQIEITECMANDEDVMDVADAVNEVTKAQETNKIYIVEAGDCLSTIADKYDMSYDSLLALNGISDSDSIVGVGDELIVAVPQPELSMCIQQGVVYEEEYMAEPTIVENDNWYNTQEVVLSAGSAGYHEVNAIVTYEDGVETGREIIADKVIKEPVAEVIERGTKIPPTYIKPLNGGTFTSGFKARWGRMHKGDDWACPIGTTIYASSAGTVAIAGTQNGYGNVVYINHPDGRQTRYGHLSKILVSVGQSVQQGETIALSGNTGRSTGPHVHFEILIGGVQVDPLLYLN